MLYNRRNTTAIENVSNARTHVSVKTFFFGDCKNSSRIALSLAQRVKPIQTNDVELDDWLIMTEDDTRYYPTLSFRLKAILPLRACCTARYVSMQRYL